MLIAGPCSLENKEQAFKIAKFVKACGATAFRGGAFKGQNRPIVNGKPEYVGLGRDGVTILQLIQDKLKIPCVCDVQSSQQALNVFLGNIEYLMVGARNMDNLCLLREIRNMFDTFKTERKIILKRGPSATIDEWIGAAEHLGGPKRVILCERGIVTFDRTPITRWRLDMVGVAHIKRYTDYQIIVDPSHGCGDKELVPLLSKMALGIADGLMIETHYEPTKSPTDANQTVDFEAFGNIANMYKCRDLEEEDD